MVRRRRLTVSALVAGLCEAGPDPDVQEASSSAIAIPVLPNGRLEQRSFASCASPAQTGVAHGEVTHYAECHSNRAPGNPSPSPTPVTLTWRPLCATIRALSGAVDWGRATAFWLSCEDGNRDDADSDRSPAELGSACGPRRTRIAVRARLYPHCRRPLGSTEATSRPAREGGA